MSTQRRAKPGGETGANGEWYEGGKFIATRDNPKRAGRSRKATRKVEIEPWKWEFPPEEGMRPIYGRMGAGVFRGKLEDGQWGLIARDVTWQHYFKTDKAIERAKEEYQAFADRFNAGERWTTPEEDRTVARATFLGGGGEMPSPVYAVSDDDAQDILDVLRSIDDRRQIWSSGAYSIAVDDYSESSSVVLMHRDELIGFYEGSCLWLDERYRGQGLSVPLILAAAMERSQDEPPTVLPSGVDCHGYSPAGLTAHEAAFAKLCETNYDVRAALEAPLSLHQCRCRQRAIRMLSARRSCVFWRTKDSATTSKLPSRPCSARATSAHGFDCMITYRYDDTYIKGVEMSLSSIAQQQRAKHLSVRLDACIDRIDDRGLVKQHAVMYAAFLTDLGAGRLDATDPNIADMVGLADEFCALVESEYQTVN